MLIYLIVHLSKKSKNGSDLKKTGESYCKVPLYDILSFKWI